MTEQNEITLPDAHWRLLIIDVQQTGIKDLCTERKATYPFKVRAFANKLWEQHGIPATVVALTERDQYPPFRYYSHELLHDRGHKDSAIQAFGLQRLGIYPHEDLQIKSYTSVFHATGFHQHLTNTGVTGTIIVGMNTNFCITASIYDSLLHGYHTIAAHDLFADSSISPEGHNSGDPKWHRARVEENLRRYEKMADQTLANAPIFAKSTPILAHIRQQPARPAPRAEAVPQSHNL